ncbi:hypothetical protein KM043_018395 [Ampulex compressa]|nr:hypothetical protein KM043_018395 [Ampulex compressa]
MDAGASEKMIDLDLDAESLGDEMGSDFVTKQCCTAKPPTICWYKFSAKLHCASFIRADFTLHKKGPIAQPEYNYPGTPGSSCFQSGFLRTVLRRWSSLGLRQTAEQRYASDFSEHIVCLKPFDLMMKRV